MNIKTLISNSIRVIIYLTIPILVFIIFYIFQDLSETGKSLSKSILNRTIKETELQIKMFINPIENSLKIIKEQGELGFFNNFENERLNQFFIPILKNTNHLSSVILANSLGEEYLLIQEDSTWLNRMTFFKNSNRKVVRSRWKYSDNNKKQLLNEWLLEREQDNNPIVTDWYTEAINHNKYEWTNPYFFDTTNQVGVTASIKWESKFRDTIIKHVIALDILLQDLSNFTTHLTVSKNGMAFIFSQNGNILGFPKKQLYQNNDTLKKYTLRHYSKLMDEDINKPITKWIEKKRTNNPFTIKLHQQDWWAQIHKYEVTENKSLFIAVIVPENDFLEKTNQTKQLIIWSFLFIAFLVVIIISGYNEKRKIINLLEKQKDEITQYNRELNQQNEEITSQRDEIEQQKNIIEDIHQEVSQSIDYATRLQQSILPEETILKKYFSQHFVLFNPKDKVSGDFYWWTHLEETTIVTASDCTGHGIPGSLMSMLGVSFLREIVQKQGVTDTSIILQKLRQEIIKALRQTGESGTQKDGMDMALISINDKTKKLQYSGANNPLYIITERTISNLENLTGLVDNSSYLLYELRPDKMPIGIYNKMDPFKTHEIQLQKGDQLYMFSDGFADQFGGPKGKKFKYKPFKKLILENAHLSMNQQQDILYQTFINWKASEEQIDDVVILGIKI